MLAHINARMSMHVCFVCLTLNTIGLNRAGALMLTALKMVPATAIGDAITSICKDDMDPCIANVLLI